ncbi:MAG: hypothetical protein IH904_05190, partial [Proteobacteria bacterium]|nr:hypothetical protein [Pseudomonadota bacterium]
AAETFDVDTGQISDGILTAAAIGSGGLTLDDPHTNVNSTDFEVVGNFNRMRITATNLQGSANFSGADIDAVRCVNSFNFGTAHIAKANLGAGTIGIQSKGGDDDKQFFKFKITIANPENEDLSDLFLKDVLPAEFDLDPDAEETADGADCPTDGVCDGVMVSGGTNPEKCTATGAEHTNQGKSNKPFKLQPDIVSITDITLGDDQSCEITVWAMTDQKSDKTNKVNFTPTECNEGTFIFLNEGVEVIDTMGTTDPSDDVTLFIDDDQIELICTGP